MFVNCLAFTTIVLLFLVIAPYSSTYSQGYNLHAGQWVKYGPMSVDVKSDNNYLRLLAKAMVSRSMQLPLSSVENTSMLDLEWILVNITNVEGNDVTFTLSAKPKFSQDVITRIGEPVNLHNVSGSNVFSLLLGKVPKLGDTYYTTYAGSSLPLYVNRTVEKYIGSHLINGFEIVGSRNSYKESDGSASEATIKLFYSDQIPLPLEISLGIEVGSPIFGTVNAKAKLSAIESSLTT